MVNQNSDWFTNGSNHAVPSLFQKVLFDGLAESIFEKTVSPKCSKIWKLILKIEKISKVGPMLQD